MVTVTGNGRRARTRYGSVAVVVALVVVLATACRIELGTIEPGEQVCGGDGAGVLIVCEIGSHAAVWDTNTQTRRALDPGPDGKILTPWDVSTGGLVVGTIWKGPRSDTRAVVWDLPAGTMREVPIDAPARTDGYAISESGIVAGAVTTYDAQSFEFETRPFRWHLATGRIEVLDLLDVDVRDINDRGQVVGGVFDGNAFVWEPEATTARFLEAPGAELTNAVGINNRGDVVGGAAVGTDYTRGRAVRWAAGATEATVLPDLGGKYARAFDINDTGTVVGTSFRPDGAQHAIRIDPGTTTATDLSPDVAWSGADIVGPTGSIWGEESDRKVVRWDPDPPPAE